MVYGDEADDLPPWRGKFVFTYKGGSSKEISDLEEKLGLLSNHVRLQYDYPVTVIREGTKIVLELGGSYSIYLVNRGDVEVSSVGKDGKKRDVSVRPTLCVDQSNEDYISLEICVDRNVYELSPKAKGRKG